MAWREVKWRHRRADRRWRVRSTITRTTQMPSARRGGWRRDSSRSSQVPSRRDEPQSTHLEEPKQASPSVDAVYAAVAARRTSFDGLLWQAPVLSLTAQAFLLTIALGAGVSEFSRIIACLLSIVVSLLTVQLLTRHRQAEITDAHLLRDMESDLPPRYQVHGPSWQVRRNATSAYAGIFEPLRRLPAYYLWAVGLSGFGIASFLTLVVSIFKPGVFSG